MFVAIIALIFNHITTNNLCCQFVRNTNASLVSASQQPFNNMKFSSDCNMQFCRQTRSALALALLPPFIPPPWRGTLKLLEPHKTTFIFSFFFCCKFINIFHHKCLSLPRLKRVQTLCQLPKQSGKSRHETPVRNTYNIAQKT